MTLPTHYPQNPPDTSRLSRRYATTYYSVGNRQKQSVGMDEKFTRFDGRLHLFRRHNSPYWFSGFHFKGKYVRRSTKEANRNAAIAAAEKWFTLKQAEILTIGMPTEGYGPTVDAIAKKALATMANRVTAQERSSVYLSGIRKILQGHILPFFGKTPIARVDVVLWNKFVEEKQAEPKPISRGTLHQLKNALRLVLNEAYRTGVIKAVPTLKEVSVGPRIKTPRVWFEPGEYRTLHQALRQHAKSLRKTRWVDDAQELYDYVIFNTNAGLRVGEARNVRFCDVTEHEETNDGEPRKFLMIKNIKGKRGTGECRTMDGAVDAFRRILERRKIDDPRRSTEPLFLAYHRDMFRAVLEKAKLRWTNDRPPRKRDLTVCRHTYISFRLLSGVSAFEIANNCRTSTQMITEHYARWLSPRLTKGLNVRNWSD